METFITITILVNAVWINSLICRKLAHWSTVPWGPLFPFKPFNCDACLTFWYTWASMLCWSLFFAEDLAHFALYGFGSIITALLNFINVKSKIEVNE